MALISEIWDLEPGDQVLFRDREWPLTVHSVDEIDERDGGIRYTRAADLRGPQGGLVVLKQSTSGRIVAFTSGMKPAFTPKRLRWYPENE